jgi:hypothetical protein
LPCIECKTGLDVAQTFPIGQLREGHGQILIPAEKPAQPDVALIALDATTKLPGRKLINCEKTVGP